MYNVLLVEDEMLVRSGMRALIDWEGNGFHLEAEATHGGEALELLQSKKIDIVITDIRMPVMDGLELIEQIRLLGIPCEIIVLSSFDDFNYVKKAMQFEVRDYIHKPTMTPEELIVALKKVAQILDKHRSMDSLQSNYKELLEKLSVSEEDMKDPSQINPLIHEAISYIHANFHENITLEKVSSFVHISPNYFSRLFFKELNQTFIEYVQDYRIKQAKRLLENSTLRTYEISEKVGYKNSKYFLKVFKKQLGMTPGEYRDKLKDKN